MERKWQNVCQQEDTLGKEEIANYQQFLLFPTEFSKDLYFTHEKTMGLFWKGLSKMFGLFRADKQALLKVIS